MSSVASESSLDSDEKELVNSFGAGTLWFQLRKVSRWDLFFLIFNIILGSQFEITFSFGIWETFFCYFIAGLGYLMLASSLAEMVSALPFSGGIYGIVRAFTHPILGFFVACFELLISLLYITEYIYRLSFIPIHAGIVPEEKVLIVCLICYIVIGMLCMIGGKIFWTSNMILAVTSLLLILIFIFGSCSTVDFHKYSQSNTFQISHAMHSLHSVSMTFLGIQLLPLSIQFSKEPKKDIPAVMFYAGISLFILSLLLIVMAGYQYPGSRYLKDFPLTWGFENIFHMTHSQAMWLNLPGLVATNFGFIYCFGRQLYCMAGSGLVPAIFHKRIPILQSPWVALLALSLSCFILSIVLFYEPVSLNTVLDYVDITCSLASYIVFISFFIAYLQFKTTHDSLQREYSSPFGMIGAIFGIFIFIFCIVGALGFQENEYIPIAILSGFSLLILAVFFIFLHGKQQFSDEEKAELFKAYLINANKASKNRLRKGKFASPTPGSKGLNNDSTNKRSSNGPPQNNLAAKSNSQANNSVSSADDRSLAASSLTSYPLATQNDVGFNHEEQEDGKENYQPVLMSSSTMMRPPELTNSISERSHDLQPLDSTDMEEGLTTNSAPSFFPMESFKHLFKNNQVHPDNSNNTFLQSPHQSIKNDNDPLSNHIASQH